MVPTPFHLREGEPREGEGERIDRQVQTFTHRWLEDSHVLARHADGQTLVTIGKSHLGFSQQDGQIGSWIVYVPFYAMSITIRLRDVNLTSPSMRMSSMMSAISAKSPSSCDSMVRHEQNNALILIVMVV